MVGFIWRLATYEIAAKMRSIIALECHSRAKKYWEDSRSHAGRYEVMSGQVWGVYPGAARHRVHLATVLLRPPFGHHPGARPARPVSLR